jgi:predicted enzyme related to lactoylglutathione lyase
MRLAAARIFVDNLQKARVFYEQSLGLTASAVGHEGRFVVYPVASCDVIVEQVDSTAPADERALVGRFTGLSFQVADIHTRYRELTERGVRFTGPPEVQPWGGTLATLCDAAGNEIQFVEYPREA